MPNAPIAPTAPSKSRPFHAPKPNFPLMGFLGLVNRWCLLLGLPLLRRLPGLRNLPGIRGHFRIHTIDLPAADRVRLSSAVNARTAAFLGPNHPEFGLDWMMDKEISTMVAPRMASWAAHGIIASAPGFWTRNNLVSNAGADAAVEYSVNWALRGRGVLLHPEGSVHWTSDAIHPLFHGIADMATEASRRAADGGTDRPVYIVPLVWKYRHVGDASGGMHRDMALIERALAIRPRPRSSVSDRFRRLQEGVLAMQMARFGFDPARLAGLHFFDLQAAFRAYLVNDLESRYEIERTKSVERTLGRLKRAIGHENTADLARVEEANRLGGFSREVYGTATLSQEQIFESLKRLRADLVRSGLRNTMHNFLPTPFGPRVAHVRVPEPIRVDPARARGDDSERKAYVVWLIEEARRRMQDALDAINREIAADVESFSRPNPFAVTTDATGAAALRRDGGRDEVGRLPASKALVSA